MTDAADFVIDLAERVSPDDVDLAPAIFEAACIGGTNWEKAVKGRRGTVFGGAAGFLDVATFTVIIDAIQHSWHYVMPVVDIALVGMHSHQIIEGIVHRFRHKKDGPEPSPHIDIESCVQTALEHMCIALRERGLSEAKAEATSADVIQIIAEKPTDGRIFGDALSRRSPK